MRKALIAAFALGLSACGATSLPAGASCSADSDCTTGSCLAFATFGDGGSSCTEGQKACSKSCSVDGDCNALDPAKHWLCFSGCNGTKFCGQTL